MQPDRTTVTSLGDGTFIIEQLGQCLRVRVRECHTKCLPPDARIATPSGDLPVRELAVGMEVWTQDTGGTRVVGRVQKIGNTAVRGEHHVARLVLADGRTLRASPEHPVLRARLVQDLRIGDIYDGSEIVDLQLEKFAGPFTYDLLPSGDTGIYWANGIPVQSTLDK